MSTERIKELLDLMAQHGLSELELEEENFRIKLKKQSDRPENADAPSGVVAPPAALPAAAPAEPAAGASAAAPDEDIYEIRSPCVGTFYRARAPEEPTFVEVGDIVDPETVVCIVEAMKVMNEVKAECNGTIEKILIPNGDPVEYDQVLFRISP